jgi:hypothetical protein
VKDAAHRKHSNDAAGKVNDICTNDMHYKITIKTINR